ncbi:MAG: Peptidase [Chitinophagaceae bacterium]|nr:Peptidase [Chitinophagaceae bacterium]
MRKLFVSVTFLLLILRSYADEGMWLPLLLGQQVYKDMVKKGLKLSAEQLYSVNKASIKDAIIIFGNGCTGEIVSNQGLIFTNHHCGYDAIATSSTVEHNYLHDGFYAADKNQEIPANKITVRFLNRIQDVTQRVMAAVGNLQGTDRSTKLSELSNQIISEVVGGDEFKSGVVASMFKGNQYFLFVYDVYKDIRLVGAPPESIGKFGGDTDNWEWPRHTGDFSVFRVYMSPDGNPANYSRNNVPLKPKYFLPVSLKGVNDGSFAMIYGYPGGTNRYETSYGIDLKNSIENPTLVKLRDMRLKYMFEEMKKDPVVKLQLAPDYANIANYWKFYEGETKQLQKFHTQEQKAKDEQAFLQWAKSHPEYSNIFNEYAANYAAWRPYSMHRQYMNEGILGSPLVAYAATLIPLENALANNNSTKADRDKLIAAATNARKAFLQTENKPSDQRILGSVLQMYYNDIDKGQQPSGFYQNLFNKYGTTEAGYQKYAADVFNNTMLLNDNAWNRFVGNPELMTLQSDPAYAIASAFIRNYNSKYSSLYSQFVTKNNDLGRMYLKGIMEMNPEKAKMMYPDANFTMRVSYGNVKSYTPRDAVHYDYICTMKGMMEKYIPGDYEFDLPQKVVDLYNRKDFGQYKDPKYNDIVVTFITTNDITGGNSGSPVINGNGELIGLAFDGNYEALSHKIAFDKDLNRTICVDVRYVLWCIDKLGGAKHIVDELKLAR